MQKNKKITIGSFLHLSEDTKELIKKVSNDPNLFKDKDVQRTLSLAKKMQESLKYTPEEVKNLPKKKIQSLTDNSTMELPENIAEILEHLREDYTMHVEQEFEAKQQITELETFLESIEQQKSMIESLYDSAPELFSSDTKPKCSCSNCSCENSSDSVDFSVVGTALIAHVMTPEQFFEDEVFDFDIDLESELATDEDTCKLPQGVILENYNGRFSYAFIHSGKIYNFKKSILGKDIMSKHHHPGAKLPTPDSTLSLAYMLTHGDFSEEIRQVAERFKKDE